MQATIMLADGSTEAATDATIRKELGGENPFWLDIEAINETGLAWLRDIFKIHPLAIEDAEEFGQRPKIAEYGEFSQIVLVGAADYDEKKPLAPESAEVHCLYAPKYLITIRDNRSAMTMDDVRKRAHVWREHFPASSVMLLYRIADALIDGYFPVMARLDDAIDDLEEEILEAPTDAQLGTLFNMKRQLVAMRKVVTPERDMFASFLAGGSDFMGMTDEAERYFRDLYDHLIRLSDLVDSYRDLLSSAVDTHLSTVSNNLNVVMKQLTILATIFLPLSFLTGFFGQNFAWLTSHLNGLAVFIVFGLGTEALAVGLLMYLFHKRGWIGQAKARKARVLIHRHRAGADRA